MCVCVWVRERQCVYMHTRCEYPVLEMNVWPFERQDSPLTHSGAAAPRSLCKVKKVIQQEMKQKLHLITAPLLSVTEEADNVGMCRGLLFGIWATLSSLDYLEEGLRNTSISMLSWESVHGLCTSIILFKKKKKIPSSSFHLFFQHFTLMWWSPPDLFSFNTFLRWRVMLVTCWSISAFLQPPT